MATMADLIRGLNTPSKKDRVTISPATSGSTLITVEMELHRSPFVYGSGTKHFSFQQMGQAVAYAKQLAAASNLRIEGNYPRGYGLRGGGSFANWSDTPNDEEYRDLCEPEEPSACLRFPHRWGRDASTREKPYGGWQSRRDEALPVWACTPGELWYYDKCRRKPTILSRGMNPYTPRKPYIPIVHITSWHGNR